MEPSDPITEPKESETAKSTFRRPAIIVSILVHVALVVVLLFWYVPRYKSSSSSKPMAAQTSSGADDTDTAPKPPPPPQPAADVPPEQIEKSVQAQIEQVRKLPDERKLSELEKNLRRLDAVANEKSVKEVTTTIASTLGLDSSQYSPKQAPADGDFDTNTGQLHDVTRTPGESGIWKYESVLVDADGRRLTVPMTAAEGETVYNTFQQMKKFPMAEGIYRSVVMPMIQKMIEAEEFARKAQIESERLNNQDGAKQQDDESID